MEYKFKYFENPLENAEFTGEACQSCGKNEKCLEGEYFDLDDEVDSVCLNCLRLGKVKVNIPNYIKDRITGQGKEEKVAELEKTPPVPWIQYNDWPVCCGDYTKYIGEWEREDFEKNSKDGDGLNYLLSILDQSTKDKIENENIFWEDIGHYTAIFVFECLNCSDRIAVPQSY
ncbi:hypothetical protein CAI16_19655 [Virgibacillus dokdonensis]|uniref:CbrC family protein n=1 Tax=Virgibacillus dokdonensis TaxID=302167 RepID=A0A3E0WGI6_9BACI|nr:CbrC family protein [Virgibacillus dokdonensis]RFA31858.1 hypothetical protein CAI16_19655 [Virgibacillus dokdonensis]